MILLHRWRKINATSLCKIFSFPFSLVRCLASWAFWYGQPQKWHVMRQASSIVGTVTGDLEVATYLTGILKMWNFKFTPFAPCRNVHRAIISLFPRVNLKLPRWRMSGLFGIQNGVGTDDQCWEKKTEWEVRWDEVEWRTFISLLVFSIQGIRASGVAYSIFLRNGGFTCFRDPFSYAWFVFGCVLRFFATRLKRHVSW